MKMLRKAALAVGVLGLLGFMVHVAIYRFSHPDMTETQIFLWSLGYWWMIVVPGLLAWWGIRGIESHSRR